MRSPTYNAQCVSWSVAKRLFNIGEVSRVDMSRPPTGLVLFRALPQYRDAEAKRLRKRVADELRKDRRQVIVYLDGADNGSDNPGYSTPGYYRFVGFTIVGGPFDSQKQAEI